MKKIKKFNELFDTEDLYSGDEVRFISGELKNEITKLIKKGDIHEFKDIPLLGKAISQLNMKFPFLDHAIARGLTPDGIVFIFSDKPGFDNAFVAQVELKDDLFNVKYGEIMEEEEHSHEKDGLNLEELVDFFKNSVYPKFKESREDFKAQQGIDIVDTEGKDPENINFKPDFNKVIYTFEQFPNIK